MEFNGWEEMDAGKRLPWFFSAHVPFELGISKQNMGDRGPNELDHLRQRCLAIGRIFKVNEHFPGREKVAFFIL